MPRPIDQSVVVITGASSGIGRAAALAFAKRGATVVLGARREDALRELAAECQRIGGRALPVLTDVTHEGSVRHLARTAVDNCGRIDTWINNAAVTMFARCEEGPAESYRRVIETNLLGYFYGARASLPVFREQGGGVLINISSVVGKLGQPYTSAYTATKYAIRGLSQSLRQELRDVPNIHVCTVLPASTDTPLFQHAANYTGRAIKPTSPIYSAQQVAAAIINMAEEPRHEITVGNAGVAIDLLQRLAPTLAERLYAAQVEKDHFQDQPANPTEGNLFRPDPRYTTVSGGWQVGRETPVLRTAAIGLAAAVPILSLFWLWPRLSPWLTAGARTAATVGRWFGPIAATSLPLVAGLAKRGTKR